MAMLVTHIRIYMGIIKEKLYIKEKKRKNPKRFFISIFLVLKS